MFILPTFLNLFCTKKNITKASLFNNVLGHRFFDSHDKTCTFLNGHNS